MGDAGLLSSGGRSVRLPGILDTINRLIGLEQTLKIIDEFGGGDLHIPRRLSAEHPLARTVGPAAAEALAEALGRDRWEPFHIPSGHVELTFHFARRLRLDGHSVSEIRRLLLQRYRLRVTERRIRALVSDIRAPASAPSGTGTGTSVAGAAVADRPEIPAGLLSYAVPARPIPPRAVPASAVRA